MKTVFVVLTKRSSGGPTHTESFWCVRTTLPAAMVAAYKIKPALVLEVSTKPGDGDEPVERAEIK